MVARNLFLSKELGLRLKHAPRDPLLHWCGGGSAGVQTRWEAGSVGAEGFGRACSHTVRPCCPHNAAPAGFQAGWRSSLLVHVPHLLLLMQLNDAARGACQSLPLMVHLTHLSWGCDAYLDTGLCPGIATNRVAALHHPAVAQTVQ